MRTTCLPPRTFFLRAGIAAFMIVLGLSGCGGGGAGGSATPATPGTGGPGGTVTPPADTGIPVPPVPAVDLPLPVISAQPLDQTVAVGQTATLTVAASGAGQLSYEWTRDNLPITGATAASYTLPPARLADSGAVYRVSIGDANGVTVSRQALLTVNGSGTRPFIGDPAVQRFGETQSLSQSTGVAVGADGSLYVPQFQGLRKISPRGVMKLLSLLECYMPDAIAADAAGTLYLSCNAAVYKYSTGGQLTLYAGKPRATGMVDGKSTEARFLAAKALAVTAQGIVYVGDEGEGEARLRRIDTDGSVSTVAGSGQGTTSADGTGAAARFRALTALAIDPRGNVLVADSTAIRTVTPAGVVTTLAGSLSAYGSSVGTVANARFDVLGGIAADAAGNIYVSEIYQNVIRKISADGQLTTLAGQRGFMGTGDGAGSASMLAQPQALAIGKQGHLYVAERFGAIREINLAGVVSTFAGNSLLPASADIVYARGHEAVYWATTGLTLTQSGDLLFPSYDSIVKASPQGDARLFARNSIGIFKFGPAIVGLKMDVGETFLSLAAGRNQTYALLGLPDYLGAKRRIVKFDSGGTLVPILLPSQAGAVGTPTVTGLAADADDTVYIVAEQSFQVCAAACTDEPRASVYRIASGGAATILMSGVTAYPGHSNLSFSKAGGVAVDANRNVYVADRGNHTVLKIAPSGQVSTLAGMAGLSGLVNGAGESALFAGPEAIASDPNGNVIVFDRTNAVIRKITAAGAVTTIAGVPGRPAAAYDATGALPLVNALGLDGAGTVYVAVEYGIIKIVP